MGFYLVWHTSGAGSRRPGLYDGGPRNVTAAAALGCALAPAAAGQQQGRALARQAALRGKRVAGLEPVAYGGLKDASEAWTVGVLVVGAWPAAGGERPTGLTVPEDLREAWAERMAIMVADGGLPPAEAER